MRLGATGAGVGLWDQRQIQHAQELGLGVKDKKSVEMVTKLLEGKEEEFSKLMTKIQGYITA